MRLVVDTSVLVGELLRAAGRERIASEHLELFLPQQMWNETQVELPRRIDTFSRKRGIEPRHSEALVVASLNAIGSNVSVVGEAVYSPLFVEANERCQRDGRDWPVVAAALALNAGIWTNDSDFLGAGVPTWTTATLSTWLVRQGT